MPTPIKLPNLGAEASEATIESWLVAVGDTVAAGDPVVAIETEKATVEIESPVSGTLVEITVPAGGVAPVGGTLGMVEEG
jgi:pyruvate/2-oxoglutarate dehydrogenase complex dihydrolipoamide acyltransferase (E2) component